VTTLSDAQQQELESLLLEFDQAWEPNALTRRTRELTSDDPHFRQVALVELVKIDLERQWKAGKQQKVEAYLQRFPELGTEQTVDPGLLLVEYQARCQVHAPASLRDFQLRFPNPFGKLRQMLEEDSDATSQPAACIDTSQSGPLSDTKCEGGLKISDLPTEFGRYRILKQLGEGGMGSVYLAHDSELDRRVAIKVPKFTGGADQQIIERFYREARTAASLRHANICPVYDVGEVEGTRYLCMAYIDGRPLSAYVRRDGSQPERQVALVIRKLALALQEAHSHGVVHRDLKPANIMIDRNLEPVVMDFGLARQLGRQDDSRLTQQGSVMGSPAYMSPEQVEGDVDRIGALTDIYSLGVIFFELLTGRAPFEGPMTAVLGQIMTQEPPRPSEFRRDVDPHLERICAKMMAKRIEDRYRSTKEVADALTAYFKASQIGDASGQLGGAGNYDERPLAARLATRPPASPRVTVAENIRHRSGPVLLKAAQHLPVKAIWGAAGLAGVLCIVLFSVMLSHRTPHGTVGDAATRETTADSRDFTNLFDGQTLCGWHGCTEYFHVEDGLLVSDFGEQVFRGPTSGCLLSDNAYADFLLKLEFRVHPGGNSGVLLRAPDNEFAYRAMEIQVVDDEYSDWREMLQSTPTQRTGSLGIVAAGNPDSRKPTGEWNTLSVQCQDRELSVELNGRLVLDVNLDEFEGKDFRGRDHPGLTRSSGHVGLLGRSSRGRVDFRNIRIKELQTHREDRPEPGFESLFDGRTLVGWNATGNVNAFSVRDGVLVISGPPGGLMYTGDVQNHNFKDFHFKAEVMTTAGANSGIFFHSTSLASRVAKQSYEVQINQTHSDPRKSGGLWGVRDVYESPVKDDEWYLQEIIVRGKRIITKINGTTVVDYTEPEETVLAGGLSSGTFVLQSHRARGKVYLRNIVVKPL
jgi:serine/threonine protein kinase